jgi:hypothetical protein
MKIRKQFATVAQRQAWQNECQRNATKRMLRQLMRKLSRLAQEPVPVGQRQLAAEYRRARAAHIASLRCGRDAGDTERVKTAMNELQIELA